MKVVFINSLIVFFCLTGILRAERPTLEPLPLGAVTADGWLKLQLERSKAGMGGNLDILEPEMIGKPFVTRDFNSPVVAGWSGEISGTYWTGLVQLAFTLNDPELIEKANRWVHQTIALQEEDGYLGSYRPTDDRWEDYSAWSSNWCYRALLSWYDATGEKEVLDAVHRGLLWFVTNWDAERKTPYAGTTLMESMVRTYLLTGDVRLVRWCEDYVAWLDANDKHHHGMKSLQRPELGFNEDHVVAFGENVKLPALVYIGNNDPEFLHATENGLRQIMTQCFQCTGAPASNFEFHSPPSCIHETEYCNFATYLNTFSWMLRITSEPKYGDFMERILFNGAMGARKKDERAIAYQSSPNQLMATIDSSTFHERSFEVYAPNFNVACCPAQSVRIYPEYVRALFLRNTDGNLYLPVYAPCKVHFNDKASETAVDIQERTAYPFHGKIVWQVKTSREWRNTFHLRLPVWCRSFRVTLNGNEIRPEVRDGWILLENTWHDDTLEVEFTMTPRIVDTKDVYFEKEPLRAVECGPLLFSLPYKELWTPIAGHPLTPLPEGWSWFNVTCDGQPGYFALDPEAIAHPERLIKRETELADGVYPWENPPLRVIVPLYRAQNHAFPANFRAHRGTLLPYGNPVMTDGDPVQMVELVPYGCTSLRWTCFPTAK